ncbi:YesL family protein [Sediminibacillus albus]|uniref:Uncharacterized membrane protein YesL n=1 Tax=Sediminibacillus albus TaxID=407036 RepID=A0A1G8YHW1_9BACI|nr:DUF624 domain-containing protein [Sediminibacillus albus]SDK02469.1 Uncharacterized membrane protein YesL [Sediminibacillus albus]
MNTSGAIYNILEWITRFAYINLLWILFTLAGGVVFGFFPATLAMFAVVRKWLTGKGDLPVFPSFWMYYRKDFLKGNLLGLFLTVTGILVFLDIRYIQVTDFEWIFAPLFAFMFLFLLFTFYIFPVFVHYDLRIGQMIKNAFLIMLVNPVNTFFMLVCLVCVYFVMRFFPALYFIFGGSVYAFITMWLSLNAFHKVAAKMDN